ncbi:MAG: efflux RND transporter periplasmic adaptor subunit [Bacteroidales bacterium]|nr:efflux RND transporter periplasmic adaptor subunit [Bacteroidales bacterium]
MKKKELQIMAVALAAAGMLLPSCKGKDGQQQGQQAPELAVLTVGESNADLETGFPCTLQGENDVEIRPQISGFLTKVYVEEGQYVNKGQIMFQIDEVSLKAAVDAAQAAVAVAQANVNTAQTNANNNKILLDKNIISAPAYQTSVDALNAAKAQLNQANANLVSARKNLSYSSVTAPESGYVGTVDYKEGTLVSPQTLLTILSKNGQIQALFSFTEKEILDMTDNGSKSIASAIAAMPPVTLLLANGERYGQQGKIVSISGVINPTTGAAQVKAIFPNPDGMLRSGNTGQVLIPSIRPNALQIPQSATYEIQDMKFVYVLGDSSKVHATPITVAEQSDGQTYIVTSGLNQGDVVVVEGVGVNVQDGMVIKPKTGGAQSAAAAAPRQ